MSNTFSQKAFPLPLSEPEAAGIPSAAIQGFLQSLARRPYRLHAFMLARNGKLCFSAAAAPYTTQTPHRVFSTGKSILALSAFFAMQEKRLRIDDSVADFFSDLLIGDSRFDSMTVRDLLTMRSGQTDDPFLAIIKDLDADLIRLFFQTPPAEAPGKTFRYNNTIPHIVYALTERATGVPFEAYQQAHLCEPLNAEIFAPTNPLGQYNPVVMAMSAETLMKFALFFLREGAWEGKQLLDAQYIREAVKLQTATGLGGNAAEYGYQIWRNAFGGYRMDGGWGQYAIVLPQENLTAVLLSDMPDSTFALEAFAAEILPHLSPSPLPPAPEAAAALRAWGAQWSLAPQGGNAASAKQGDWFAKDYRFTDRAMGVRFSAMESAIDMHFTINGNAETFRCGLGGVWEPNARHLLVQPERTIDNGVYCMDKDECLLTGVWRTDDTLDFAAKSLGALGEYLYRFTFTNDGLTLSYPQRVCRGGPSLDNAICLFAEGSAAADEHHPK
jgi:CubicO group peptidase (beta-lactamase class C family)